MYGRTQQWPIQGAVIFQAYGPGQSPRNLIPAAVTAALAGEDFPMTAGQQQRDWIEVSDVVGGMTAVLDSNLPPGETVDLGSGQTTSIADVVQLIYQLAGKGGNPLIGVLPSRPGEEATQVADAARTRELVGWGTAVSLADGLRKMVKN
jgi:UDP-glucose 4-epimerase